MRNRIPAVGVIAVCGLVGLGLFQIYSAIAYGEIRIRWLSGWVSKEADPDGFALALIMTSLAVLVVGGLLALVLWGWRSERRWLRQKRRTPPQRDAL